MIEGRFIGVDVGGTKVAAASFERGESGEPHIVPTELSSSDALLDQLVAAIDAVRGVDARAVGIGVPSVIDFATGRIRYSVNIPLADLPLRELLTERVGLPVFLENDASCAALAEAYVGEELVTQDLVMYTVGTGVGGGVVIGGRLFRGSTGAAPEMGHQIIGMDLSDSVPPGTEKFPQVGSLESLAAGRVLDRLAQDAGFDGGKSVRRGRSGRRRGRDRLRPAHRRAPRRGDRQRDQHLRSRGGRGGRRRERGGGAAARPGARGRGALRAPRGRDADGDPARAAGRRGRRGRRRADRGPGARLTAYRIVGGAEVLVEDGRIVSSLRSAPEVVHGFAFPGFNDAHVHFPTWSVAQQQVRLEGTRTVAEAVDRVAAAARGLAPGRWLRGLGWRSGDWEGAPEPDRHVLDRAAPGVPIALMSRDYHSLWLSSAALERATGSLMVPGGVVEVDASGEPTGVLRETSAWTFRDRFSAPSFDEYVEAMRTGLQLAASRGVTAIHDKDGWLNSPALFAATATLTPHLHMQHQDVGEPHRGSGVACADAAMVRIWQSVPHDRMGEQPGDYVKAFMDGTVGSATARLLSGGGVEITKYDDFVDIIRRATALRLPVAVHAIGDLANREALDAFAVTRDEWAPLGLRQRIEHAQLLAPEDAIRFAQLGVTASVQFSHAPSDRDLADTAWAGMTDRAYAYRTLLDAGARLANGSDAPVEELDPLAGLRAGVERTLDDRPAWHPEQRIPLQAALDATCVAPAWLAGDEHRRGRLEPGFDADLTVLDRDPFTDLAGAQVVATMVGGQWTFYDL